MNVVMRDERTTAVENASYRVAYGFVAFAVLLDVIYRSGVRGEAPWDLLAIVIVSGIGSSLYLARYRVLTRQSVGVLLLASLLAAIFAAVLAVLLSAR
jgi:hypothetical protein